MKPWSQKQLEIPPLPQLHSPLSTPGTLTRSLSHSTPPSAVSWCLLEGSARRLVCLLWQPGPCSLSPGPPPPTLPLKPPQAGPAAASNSGPPTWQVHTPVSMPTCSTAPMTTSGQKILHRICHRLTHSHLTPQLLAQLLCAPLYPLSSPRQPAGGQGDVGTGTLSKGLVCPPHLPAARY